MVLNSNNSRASIRAALEINDSVVSGGIAPDEKCNKDPNQR